MYRKAVCDYKLLIVIIKIILSVAFMIRRCGSTPTVILPDGKG